MNEQRFTVEPFTLDLLQVTEVLVVGVVADVAASVCAALYLQAFGLQVASDLV